MAQGSRTFTELSHAVAVSCFSLHKMTGAVTGLPLNLDIWPCLSLFFTRPTDYLTPLDPRL